MVEGGATLNLKANTLVGGNAPTDLLMQLTAANNGDILEINMGGTDRRPPSLTQRLTVSGIKAPAAATN
jgi:hypothetical protein